MDATAAWNGSDALSSLRRDLFLRMADRTEAELLQAAQAGDQSAFERLYDLYHQQVQLMAWRVCHRSDWIDDILNETWCRAFRQRGSFDPARSFPVWLAGILQNVYREHCRKSPLTLRTSDQGDEREAAAEESPEHLAAEAEWLAALNDCVGRLAAGDAEIVRLRFFDDLPLRTVAERLRIPESTLRDRRLPAAFEALRRCLAKKKIDISQFFPAHDRPSDQ